DPGAARAGGADAGLQPGAGVLVGGAAGGPAGHGDGGDAGLGAGAGRVRPGAGLQRGDADAHRGAADDGVPGAVDRQPARRGGRVSAHGRRGHGGAADRARVWYGADQLRETAMPRTLSDVIHEYAVKYHAEYEELKNRRNEWLDSLRR